MIIESSPINLDPRVGVDGQSQRIDELLFDSLLRHDDHFNLQPELADRWEIPDPLTYVFHLASGRALSQRTAAHLSRREVDLRLADQRQNPQPEGRHVRAGQPHRRARRLHRHLSSEAAVRLAAVESVGRRRHRSLRQRRRLQPQSRSARARSASSARSRTRMSSSSAIPTTGARLPSCIAWNSR